MLVTFGRKVLENFSFFLMKGQDNESFLMRIWTILRLMLKQSISAYDYPRHL